MATHDYVIANGTGAAVRSDLNNALAAIVSNNSGSSEPGTTYAYQWWADTNANVLKIRNSSNDGWITLRELDGTMLIEDGSASSPGLAFADDVNTGIFSPAADQIGFATGGAERLEIGSSEVVFNDPSNDVDFRVESNGQTHMLYVDAGNDRVGVGESSPAAALDVKVDTNPVLAIDRGSANAANFNLQYNGTLTGQISAANADFQISAVGASTPMSFYANGSERARIDSSGNVGINASSPGRTLDVDGVIRSDGTSGAFELGDNSSTPSVGCAIHRPANDTMAFVTGGSERMRIDSSGNVGIATSSISGANLVIATNSEGGSGIKLIGKSANGGAEIDFRNNADSTLNGFIEFNDNGGVLSTVVNQPQIFRTNNTERVRIGSDGFIGLQGATSDGGVTSGKKFYMSSNGSVYLAMSNDIPLYVNRNGNDGSLIEFRQSNSPEGNISVSGSTVSYNGGHLSRWSQLAGNAERTEILRGSVLSNLDEMCAWAHAAQDAVLYTEEDELPEGASVGDVKTPAVEAYTEDNEQLNRMKVSDVEGDANVAGVFQGWDDDDDTYTNDFYCAMTGDFVIRIAQGTTVARGDLLMSAGDGTAKPQDDDIVRSKTIAKVTSTTVSTTYADGSYCVPCVLMAC